MDKTTAAISLLFVFLGTGCPVHSNLNYPCKGTAPNIYNSCGCHPSDVPFITRVQELGIPALALNRTTRCIGGSHVTTGAAGVSLEVNNALKVCIDQDNEIDQTSRLKIVGELEHAYYLAVSSMAEEKKSWLQCYGRASSVEKLKRDEQDRLKLTRSLNESIDKVNQLQREVAALKLQTEQHELDQQTTELLKQRVELLGSQFSAVEKKREQYAGLAKRFGNVNGELLKENKRLTEELERLGDAGIRLCTDIQAISIDIDLNQFALCVILKVAPGPLRKPTKAKRVG